MKRNSWADYAKAIGIILVVYGHVARGVYNAGIPLDPNTFNLVDSVLYSFHMPLFFFLSGLFFYESLVKRGAIGLTINKLDTIIYPYIAWSLLQGFVEAFLAKYTNGSATFSEVLSFAWQPRAQFWFMYALFLIFIVSSLAYSVLDRSKTPLLLILFGVLYIFKKEFSFNLASSFILGNTFFFILGVYFNDFKSSFEKYSAKLAMAFGLLFIAGQYIYHQALGLNYTSGGLNTLALATTSIFFAIALSMCLARLEIRWLLYIGASSMAIYLMHILAGSGARVILNKFLTINSTTVHLAIGTLVGVVAPLIAQEVIKRCKLTFLIAPPISAAKLFSLTKKERAEQS